MKLSVVIVNYNVKYFLEQCLYAVRKAKQHLPIEVFVVDNNSVDGSMEMLKEKFPEVEFKIVGTQDNSLDAISIEEVKSWSEYVDYEGSTKDVRPYIKKCHVYVLPSYHEGLPRSTLEAMSMGRPILTTNASGCKETVDENINGFLVPIGSSKELAKRMIWFIKNRDEIKSMGEQSRKIVEKRFDVRKVNQEMLKILEIN